MAFDSAEHDVPPVDVSRARAESLSDVENRLGLITKLEAYRLRERGLDTLAPGRALGGGDDERSFAVAAS